MSSPVTTTSSAPATWPRADSLEAKTATPRQRAMKDWFTFMQSFSLFGFEQVNGCQLLQNCNKSATGFRPRFAVSDDLSDRLTGKSQDHYRSASRFALDRGRAAVKIDNRLHQSEPKAGSSGTAGRIAAIKAI